MGRDNQARMRQKEHLKRTKPKRTPCDRVLIVCEGSKTEPFYFNALRRTYKLNSVKVISSTSGTTPQQVVNDAVAQCKNTKRWERVYCVFDRDDHQSFDNALNSIKANNKKYKNDLKEPIRLIAIPSNPCFDLWPLLHFVHVTRETHRNEVFQQLRKYMPSYEKGMTDLFSKTEDKLPIAIDNAKKLEKQYEQFGAENPRTDVHLLVEYLLVLNQYKATF